MEGDDSEIGMLFQMLAEFNQVNRLEHITSALYTATEPGPQQDFYWLWNQAAQTRWENLADEIDQHCEKLRCELSFCRNEQMYVLKEVPK